MTAMALPQYLSEGELDRGPWRKLRPPDEAWRERAACKGKPVDWWLPPVTASGHAVRYPPEAVALCDACPVREQCLDFAIAHDELGYWGGTGERERRRVAWERRLARERESVNAEA